MRRIKSSDDNIWQRKFASTHESEDDIDEDDKEEDDIDKQENDIDKQENDIDKQENAVAIQNSFRLIYNVLSETKIHMLLNKLNYLYMKYDVLLFYGMNFG
ncbi:unnamed protein product [Rotaria magnacalcarata]|uniref:Uncharacterized protein n=2 Tax=Rotaria magnacalcarata TaxID=392030 RepID=A0A820TY20_9BILA|nr:unnamed protein product [Rotaria magnacalcarata]